MTKRISPPKKDPKVRSFAIEAARLLADRRCEDVCLLDARNVSQVCDYILIASGTSDRQMKSIAAELEDLGKEHGEKVFRTNRDEGVTWIVIDFVDLVVHLLEPNQRAYYDLENLWSDAETVAWEREAKKAAVATAARNSEPEPKARQARKQAKPAKTPPKRKPVAKKKSR